MLRTVLLKASDNRWLREHAVRTSFVRRAVSRFMPGESFDDMLGAARTLAPLGFRSVFTRLGENVTDLAEAAAVADHYVDGIARIRDLGLDCEPSIKLTQLGLDIDRAQATRHARSIAERAHEAGSYTWIDMEQSSYVDATLDVADELRAVVPGVGVCLQAYLRRTPNDLARMLDHGIGVRLVKGAYREAPAVALTTKPEIDASYTALAKTMLSPRGGKPAVRAVFGTHDPRITRQIAEHARTIGVLPGAYEFHMLYGIQGPEQRRLAAVGESVRVLIAYGAYWFPWYMRRLAERPANLWFVTRSLLTGGAS